MAQDAYDLSPARLEARAAMGEAAASGRRADVDAAAQAELDVQVARLKAAQGADDTQEAALAAVELYRLLSISVRHPGKAPAGVRLLDYAGLRYNAGRRGRAARWDDMAAAVAVARTQWLAVSPLVKDPSLAGQMDKAIADMDAASQRKDEKAAARAVHAEQDLVESLEAYFNKA